jgi:hypothetical protein
MAWRDIEDEKELEAANAPDMQKLSGTNFGDNSGEE